MNQKNHCIVQQIVFIQLSTGFDGLHERGLYALRRVLALSASYGLKGRREHSRNGIVAREPENHDGRTR